MATVNEKMTIIANEIRTLSGTSAPMGLDAMAVNVGTANTEINTQANLMSQIQAILESKGANGTPETWTFTLEDNTVVEKVVLVQ